MFEGLMGGGQLMLTTEVENFPGFPEGIMGPDLMQNFRKQAERFGTRIETRDVTKVDLSSHPFRVWVDDQEYETKSVIVATGATAKMLGLPSEQALIGKGVSTCATCDGAFFREQEICLVGGGDSALEEAIFLTRFASKVTLIHRRDELRASKVMQDKAKSNPKIHWQWNSVVDEVLGETVVEGVRVKDVKNGETTNIPCTGLFIAIGHTPNTKMFEGQLELEDNGYLKTYEGSKTSKEGVFACGDVQDFTYRQAITAAGSGCMAALDCERWLEHKGL